MLFIKQMCEYKHSLSFQIICQTLKHTALVIVGLLNHKYTSYLLHCISCMLSAKHCACLDAHQKQHDPDPQMDHS